MHTYHCIIGISRDMYVQGYLFKLRIVLTSWLSWMRVSGCRYIHKHECKLTCVLIYIHSVMILFFNSHLNQNVLHWHQEMGCNRGKASLNPQFFVLGISCKNSNSSHLGSIWRVCWETLQSTYLSAEKITQLLAMMDFMACCCLRLWVCATA